MSGRREGLALVLAVTALLVLSVLTLGLLYVATQELLVVRAREAWFRARLGAESAVRAALAGWSTAEFRELPVGASRPVPGAAGVLPGGVRHGATVERLAGPLFLVRGEGWTGGEGGGSRAEAASAVLVRGIEPGEVWAGFAAAITSGGEVVVGGGGEVDGLDASAPPPGWPAALCPPTGGQEPGAWPGGAARPGIRVPDAAAVTAGDGSIHGEPPIAVDPGAADSATFARLGPLAWEDLEALADHIAGGALDLAPRYREGACDTAARGNWGSPLDPEGPCGDFFPLIFARGDLTIRSGAGQGVLVVGGDLVLERGVRFYGPVLVRGRTVVLEDAAIYGALRAGAHGASTVVDDGAVAYRSCAIARALARSPGLDRPLRSHARWWLPAF
jgi:hypothetical protein